MHGFAFAPMSCTTNCASEAQSSNQSLVMKRSEKTKLEMPKTNLDVSGTATTKYAGISPIISTVDTLATIAASAISKLSMSKTLRLRVEYTSHKRH